MFAYMNLGQKKFCTVCNKTADYFCERCGDSYCSCTCQTLDWHSHRMICFKMPRLIPFDEIKPIILTQNVESSNKNEPNIKNELRDYEEWGSVLNAVQNLSNQNLTDLVSNTMKQIKIDHHKESFAVERNLSQSTGFKEDNYDDQFELGELIVNQPIETKQENYQPHTISLEENARVQIIHVESNRLLHVIAVHELKNWHKINERVEIYAQTASKLNKNPEIDFIILAKCSNGQYGRAVIKVLHESSNKAKVEFLEFGESGIINVNEMKCLSAELVNLPRYLNKVTLYEMYDVTQHSHIDLHIDYLNQLKAEQTEFILIDVKLIEKSSTRVHIKAKLLIATNSKANNVPLMDSISIPENQISNEFNEDVSHMDIERPTLEGENLEVMIIETEFKDNAGVFVISSKNIGAMLKNFDHIKSLESTIEYTDIYYPKLNELCLAKSVSDEQWYRGIVKDIQEDSCTMFYLDFGTTETININQIRKMFDELLFPCYTVFCILNGVETITPKIKQHLEEMLPSYQPYKFDRIVYDGKQCICYSENIIKSLKQA